jgi:hypothetical protein
LQTTRQSLLSGRRRQIHSTVAEALERDLPEAAESQPEMIEPIYPLRPPQADPEAAEGQPEMIAQHYTAAEMPERAIPYWLRAGEHSRGRLAILEAIGHFERGLTMARALPASPSLVQAGKKFGDVAWRCNLSPRTDDAELAGLRGAT